MGFEIHFWGVRGSIPCPGPETVRYGGNTPCVEMRVGGHRLIFDAGTGIRKLGERMLPEQPVEAHLFFSHTHWDHIQGFPFFAPAFNPDNRFIIHGPPQGSGESLETCLTQQMKNPHFPVPMQEMKARLRFEPITDCEPIKLGEVTVEHRPIPHPGGALGYRVSWRGLSAVYATDTEPPAAGLDPGLTHLARNADLLIMDATYTDNEYRGEGGGRRGWGHSTWQDAVELAHSADVRKLALFHHEPGHNDAFLDAVAEEAARAFPECFVAREGQSLRLGAPSA